MRTLRTHILCQGAAQQEIQGTNEQPGVQVRVYKSGSQDPFFNLATEEWLFTRGDAGVHTLFLWRNGPSVIIGRFQNAWKECHVQRMDSEGVNLVRRKSGGGAVYQDLGNSIFTFISPKDADNIPRNNDIVVKALKHFGIDAKPTGRNDIVVDSLKVSGAAFKHARHTTLHHGTLLVDVDMAALGNYLNPNKAKLESKGIASVRARVMNLRELSPGLDHDTLSDALIESFFASHGIRCEVEMLDVEDLRRIPELQELEAGLRNTDWRFGKDPDMSHHLETKFDWGGIDIHLNASKGVITQVKVFSDALNVAFIERLEKGLVGCPYSMAGVAQLGERLKEEGKGELDVKNVEELCTWLGQSL
eukprot:gene9314-11033_t